MNRIANILFLILIVFYSCNNSGKKAWQGECVSPHDIGTIEIIPSLDNNALRIIFTVETAKMLDSYIRYWEYTGTDSIPPGTEVFYSPLCENMKNHELMIVNLKPGMKYNFNVVVQNKVCKTFSKTYDFETPERPPWLTFYGYKDNLQNVNFDGYVHFHSRMESGYLYIMNSQGNLVWYKQIPKTIKVSKFTKDATFLIIMSEDTMRYASGRKIAEVDLFGQLLYHFDSDEKGIDRVFHHEIDYDENGNIMTLINDERIVDLSEVGGNKSDTIKGDGILIFNKKDEVIWEWSVFDVMNPAEYSNILNERDDWLHANALCQDTTGNYIISFRNNSQIWKVDKETGEIIWKLGGDDGDFGLPDSLKFYGQHNVQINKNGHLVLLDNGNKLVKPGLYSSLRKEKKYRAFMNKENPDGFVSRQLTFYIDEQNMRADLVDEVAFHPEDLTKSQGSSECISDSLLLFCSTNSNRILFTNSKGESMGSFRIERPSYRAQYIPKLYETNYVK